MRSTRTRLATLLTVVVTATTLAGALAPLDARAGVGWTRTRTEAYDMGDVGPMLGMLSTGGCGLGTVCFGYPIGDTFTVKIVDDSGRKVGGVVRVVNSGGWTVLYRPFCGTTGPLSSVRGKLTVHLDAPGDVSGTHWFNGPGCREIDPLLGTVGGAMGATTRGATSGRVHVTFTDHG